MLELIRPCEGEVDWTNKTKGPSEVDSYLICPSSSGLKFFGAYFTGVVPSLMLIPYETS